MPRSGRVDRRIIRPDPVYQSRLVSKFINNLMGRGKKSLAQAIFYDSLAIIENKLKKEPLEVFEAALKNVMPQLEVKSRRVGGSTYQVPVEVRPERRYSLAMRWLLTYTRQRKGRSMAEKLAAELIDAANNTGTAVKKKEDIHKMGEANRAFAQYRW